MGIVDSQQHLVHRIDAGLSRLDPGLRARIAERLCIPSQIDALTDPTGERTVSLVQVTARKARQESSYEVVFDTAANAFGLIAGLEDGRVWYMGPYGEFDEAVQSM